MKRINKVLFLIAILSHALVTSSRAEALDMADFKAVIAKIKVLNRYSYAMTTTATFPNGQTSVMRTNTFMDIKKMNYAYRTDKEQVILNRKWFYKAMHDRKVVSVFDVNKYAEQYPGPTGDLTMIFRSTLSSDLLDSLITLGARLKSAKKQGNISSFEFEFGKEAALKSMIVKFNSSTELPESIYMHSVYIDEAGRTTSYKILCDAYSSSFPDTEFNADSYFSVSGKKVTLLKFKNYTISSIL